MQARRNRWIPKAGPRRPGVNRGSADTCAGRERRDRGGMRTLSLEYHDVVPGSDYDVSGFPGPRPRSYKLSRAAFEEHLEAIARSARSTPTRTMDWLAANDSRRPVFLTFDDGGISAYTC